MASRPGRPCRTPRCPHLSHDSTGYCSTCLPLIRKLQDAQRPSSTQRGYDYRWQKYRLTFLNHHPLCADCLRMTPPRYTPATVVDHIIPHRGDQQLMWDPANHQALCAHCHNTKTAREDGAFNNPTSP